MKDGSVYANGFVEDVLTKENLKAVYEMDFEIHKVENKKQMFFMPVIL